MKLLRINSLGYEAGGVENGIVLIDHVLREEGHTVKVLASDERPDLPHFNDYSFRAFSSTPSILKPLYGCFYPHSFFALRKVLEEYQPDLVQLHSISQVSPSILFLLRSYPTVLTIHGAEQFTRELLLWAFPSHFFTDGRADHAHLTRLGRLHYLYHRYVSGTIYRLGFRLSVDTFLVLSRYMQGAMRRQGIVADYVPNATRLFEPAPIDVDGTTLLSVGRLEEIKGVQHAIRALDKVRAKHPAARLIVAGDGGYRGELARLVAELNLGDHVTFAGHCSRSDLYELYRRATVVLLPSLWPEPFGKVGIEAMSVGRPVVASRVGGIGEWLTDGETGYLVAPGDIEAMAERISTLLEHPERLAAFSAAAVARVKAFDVRDHVRSILALYEATRARHARRRQRAM